MAIKKIQLENFTVFEKLELELSDGINVFIGENGTGKTHLMKLIYSACQAVRKDVSFPQKIVKVFCPDDFKISRLIKRIVGPSSSKIKVHSDTSNLTASFSTKTKKWDAEVTGEEKWEKQLGDLTSTFIPAKEILSNAYNLSAAVAIDNVRFDDTYIDIINSAKIDISAGRNTANREKQLGRIEKIIDGKVYFDTVKDEFYLKKGSSKLEFNIIAEGVRKIALLWQLIKNGTLEQGSILFWDEPEANINPVHIPIIVEMLLELQYSGVQIFVSTHDYIFAKYFEVKRKAENTVVYHSLYKENDTVLCESNENFRDLKQNPITKAFDKLLDEVYDLNLGE